MAHWLPGSAGGARSGFCGVCSLLEVRQQEPATPEASRVGGGQAPPA